MCARSHLWGFAFKALALEAIAKEQALSGRLDLAFESYVLIEPTEKERSQALLAIVEAQAKAGQWAEARQSATKIRVDESLARALATLAAAQAKGGHRKPAAALWADALRAIQRIGAESDRAWALRDLGVELARSGFGRQAVETADSILTNRNHALPQIAPALADAEGRDDWKSLPIPCA